MWRGQGALLSLSVEGTEMAEQLPFQGDFPHSTSLSILPQNFMRNCICIQIYAFAFLWEVLHRLQKDL